MLGGQRVWAWTSLEAIVGSCGRTGLQCSPRGVQQSSPISASAARRADEGRGGKLPCAYEDLRLAILNHTRISGSI